MNVFISIIAFLKEMILTVIDLVFHNLQLIFAPLFEGSYIDIIWSTVMETRWIIDFKSVYSNGIGLAVTNNFNTKYFFVISLSLLLACIILLVLKNFRSDFTSLDSTVLLDSFSNEETKDLVIRNKIYMSREKEKSILNLLVDCERNKFFLDKELKMGDVSTGMGIDEKCLTYIIKKHRGKDYATYVNDLRIQHIVSCLEGNPAYLEYKISYLASQCGFTSHSGFTITFKRITGVCPSVYISNLKNKSSEAII